MERLSIDEVIAHCNRQTKDYERLNGKTELENADISLNFIKQYWEHRQVAEWLKKLKTYKDAEEQGLLLRLPCKVRDTVYRLIPTTYRHIESLMIREFVLADKGFCFRTEKTNINYSCADFGKTVFLTEEQAEQALKQMGESERMKQIGFHHGALADSYEQQANKQGFTLGDKAELFDKINFSYNLLRIHGYLTDKQADSVCQKIQKNLVKSIKLLAKENKYDRE